MATLREELVGFKVLQEQIVKGLDEVKADQKTLLKTSHSSPCPPVNEAKKSVSTVHKRVDSLQRAFTFSGIIFIVIFLAGILWRMNGGR